MMGAVARAARAGGAHTTGVIPQALLDVEVGDRDADELLVVDDMRARKGLMDERSEAFLALAGGIGTLEELFEVLGRPQSRLHVKPVVVLDPDGLYAPLRRQLDVLLERGFVRGPAMAALQWATSWTRRWTCWRPGWWPERSGTRSPRRSWRPSPEPTGYVQYRTRQSGSRSASAGSNQPRSSDITSLG
jgi:uncharacterized protein (TIGR00730 family)